MNIRKMILISVRLCFYCIFLVLSIYFPGIAAPVHATVLDPNVYTVDTTTDAVDADLTDGQCQSSDGGCTLRAAVQQANYTDLVMIRFCCPLVSICSHWGRLYLKIR